MFIHQSLRVFRVVKTNLKKKNPCQHDDLMLLNLSGPAVMLVVLIGPHVNQCFSSQAEFIVCCHIYYRFHPVVSTPNLNPESTYHLLQT